MYIGEPKTCPLGNEVHRIFFFQNFEKEMCTSCVLQLKTKELQFLKQMQCTQQLTAG